MSNHIRFATENDIDIIYDFINQLALYEKMEKEVFLKKENIQRYIFGTNPVAEVLILERETKPVGFALFFHNFSTFEGKPGLYLEDLFVVPQHRGFGLGKLALKTLAKIARDRDCKRFEWVCLDWNKSSIEFYERQGAQAKKQWIIFRMDGDELKNY